MSNFGSPPMSAMSDIRTAQAQVWMGEFGQAYTDRNMLDPAELDALWARNYGVTKSEINELSLRDIPKEASFLEVGCNVGNQLLLLQQLGYNNLSGVEIQSYALELARSRLYGVDLRQGSALALPYSDNQFDVVFTSGVLIHIAPEDLSHAMSEIHRCTKKYIWGFEYYAPELMSVNYRGHDSLLWKMDYAGAYLARFKDLDLVRQCHLAYLQNENVDSVFLLRKRSSEVVA